MSHRHPLDELADDIDNFLRDDLALSKAEGLPGLPEKYREQLRQSRDRARERAREDRENEELSMAQSPDAEDVEESE